jgi:hypothetical protein
MERDMIGWSWQDWLPHVEDWLRSNEMAAYGTFIGPDGTEITYKHVEDTCECSECDTARWQKIEKEEMNRKPTDKRVLENTAFGVPPCEDCGELPCQCRRV